MPGQFAGAGNVGLEVRCAALGQRLAKGLHFTRLAGGCVEDEMLRGHRLAKRTDDFGGNGTGRERKQEGVTSAGQFHRATAHCQAVKFSHSRVMPQHFPALPGQPLAKRPAQKPHDDDAYLFEHATYRFG